MQQRRRLPSHSQKLIASAQCRPDFLYQAQQAAIFVDGPIHDDPVTKSEDALADERLEDVGYEVIRFHHGADWTEIFNRYPSIFGPNGGSA